jgi:hypothetical protein
VAKVPYARRQQASVQNRKLWRDTGCLPTTSNAASASERGLRHASVFQVADKRRGSRLLPRPQISVPATIPEDLRTDAKIGLLTDGRFAHDHFPARATDRVIAKDYSLRVSPRLRADLRANLRLIVRPRALRKCSRRRRNDRTGDNRKSKYIHDCIAFCCYRPIVSIGASGNESFGVRRSLSSSGRLRLCLPITLLCAAQTSLERAPKFEKQWRGRRWPERSGAPLLGSRVKCYLRWMERGSNLPHEKPIFDRRTSSMVAALGVHVQSVDRVTWFCSSRARVRGKA